MVRRHRFIKPLLLICFAVRYSAEFKVGADVGNICLGSAAASTRCGLPERGAASLVYQGWW